MILNFKYSLINRKFYKIIVINSGKLYQRYFGARIVSFADNIPDLLPIVTISRL